MHYSAVARNRSREFRFPVFDVRTWDLCLAAARVTVPEAPVYEDYAPEPGKYDVRCAGQVFAMELKSLPERV